MSETNAWGIVTGVLERGWSVEILRCNDQGGPGGEPTDPQFPVVYSVHFKKYDPPRNRLLNARGRNGRIAIALAQAWDASIAYDKEIDARG